MKNPVRPIREVITRKIDLLQLFMSEVDFRNEKKEHEYSIVDNELRKERGGKTHVSTTTVIDAVAAEHIETIHNHPVERPPSPGDIFALLSSKAHKKDIVITHSGTLYIMIRNDNTSNLTYLRKLTREEAKQSLHRINTAFRGAKITFSKTYHDFTRVHLSKLNIKTQEEAAARTEELQKLLLYDMARIYRFDVEVKQV
jgi:hypothetical protein